MQAGGNSPPYAFRFGAEDPPCAEELSSEDFQREYGFALADGFVIGSASGSSSSHLTSSAWNGRSGDYTSIPGFDSSQPSYSPTHFVSNHHYHHDAAQLVHTTLFDPASADPLAGHFADSCMET